ncbi:hypothetical protein [Ornithinimicrobium cavernae]|uniref:hypothetical protein n=1 Tax=Ornithinimicrobium cavernae TaxID=2666047 RepID=UPI00192A43CD|nr:hypothetical protein [Ornithinimicrobium cavernae]
MNELSFVVADMEGSVELVPVVDGVSLAQLVGDYESAHGMTPSGSYAGLIPAHFNFGDLTTYYLGQNQRQWPGTGRMWLLGCDCGEVGCWPLEVTTTIAGGRVTWTDFRQPHRPDWDYAAFGPFTFEESQYRAAVAGAASAASA